MNFNNRRKVGPTHLAVLAEKTLLFIPIWSQTGSGRPFVPDLEVSYKDENMWTT